MLSASVFYNDYDRLILYVPLPLDTVTLAPGVLDVCHLLPVNSGSAHSHGAELSGMWQPMPRWRLLGEISYLDLQRSACRAAAGENHRRDPRHNCRPRCVPTSIWARTGRLASACAMSMSCRP